MRRNVTISFTLACFASLATISADPCGMVQPIYTGNDAPITRIGEQTTYVFYKDGIETFVIRPGFSGKVDEFGMLIPFPTPPAIRKVPDNVFPHIAAAIDPPEVVIDLRIRDLALRVAPTNGAVANRLLYETKTRGVRVLRQEAVGMYEVAVLEAGSAAALKKWMDDHGYRYPNGMDKVTNDYVDDGWCFVAVKAKVGPKGGVDPKPGQRNVKSRLPSGATFDGYVQAMGFRFKTDELVVPMRLSAFNDSDSRNNTRPQSGARNIVYLLTDGPKRIRSIPEEYVVRQVTGKWLVANVVRPLPLRIIGGGVNDLERHHRANLAKRRDPEPKNGVAKELFASDVQAVATSQLALPHEEQEKELLRIGERFGLRGTQIDKLNTDILKREREKTTNTALDALRKMTLTVVDGNFPRKVIAEDNLKFVDYTMPKRLNSARSYDAKTKRPAPIRVGNLISGVLNEKSELANGRGSLREPNVKRPTIVTSLLLGLAAILVGLSFVSRRR